MLRPQVKTLKVHPGEIVRWDGTHYVVAACRAGVTTLKAVSDGARVDVDLVAFAGDDSFEVVGRHGTVAATAADQDAGDRIVLMSLSDDQKRNVLWWRDHINEVQQQVVNPMDPDAKPRPGYEVTHLTARRETKVAELEAAGYEISARTFARKEKAYAEHGLLGLLDGRGSRTGTGTATPVVDARLEQAVVDVLAETIHQSTVSRQVHLDRVKALVRHRHGHDAEPVEIPSDRTLRRLFDAHDPAKLSTGKATTRRTEANRPDRMFMPLAAVRPGQIVEADSTPLNMQILMPDGKTVSRPILTVLVDRCTRSIIAWAFHEDAASGYDIAYLIARALLPMQCWPGAPEHLRLVNAAALPGRQMIALDERQRAALAKPYIVPETITTDRGKDYLSANVLRACAMFGISLNQAPPHSPTAKGVVERTLGSIDTMWMAHHDRYVGNAVGNRGRQLRGEGLTLAEVEQSFAEWVVSVWQNRPHPSLVDRDLPGRRFSPNQMFAACFDSSPGVPVPIDVDTFIDLLPTVERTVQAAGIQVGDEMYDSEALNGWRKTKHPHGPGGKWVVHHDPYDLDRVWVRHPETTQFIECAARGVRLGASPLGPSTLAHLATLPAADPDVQHDWAAQHLDETELRRAAIKREQRAATRTATRDARSDARSEVGVPDGEPPTDETTDSPRSRRQRKGASTRARRDLDDMPKPGPVQATPLDPAPPTRTHPGDYTLGRDDEDLWDALDK